MNIQAASQVVTKTQNLPPTDSRERVKQFVQKLQDDICASLEQPPEVFHFSSPTSKLGKLQSLIANSLISPAVV